VFSLRLVGSSGLRFSSSVVRAVLRTLLVAMLIVGARPAAAQFTVAQLEEHLWLGRDSLVQVIVVKSESDSVQQLRLEVKDWYRDSLGNNRYDTLGAHASSCRDRLRVFPMALQLAPRQTEYVRVAYAPTGADDPGCWSIVLMEALKPPSTRAAGGPSVNVTVLTGVKFYVHRAAEVADASIDYADVELSYERVEKNGRVDSTEVRDAVVRFVNTGTAHLRVKSSVEIRSETTQLLQTLAGPDVYLTPDAFRDVIVRVPPLPRGRYFAVALLDFGGAEIKAAQVEFDIP